MLFLSTWLLAFNCMQRFYNHTSKCYIPFAKKRCTKHTNSECFVHLYVFYQLIPIRIRRGMSNILYALCRAGQPICFKVF